MEHYSMSSDVYDPTHSIELNPSPQLTLLLLLIHLLALLTLLYTELPLIVVVLLALAILISAYHLTRLHALRSAPRAVIRIVELEEGEWELYQRDGGRQVGRLLPMSYLHRWCSVLLFAVDRQRLSLVIWPDALERTLRRRLVVRLKRFNPEG